MDKKLILTAATGLLALASFASSATPVQTASNDIVAREATEAPRGADNNNQRRHRGGRVSEDASEYILARRGADDPPGTERPGEVHGKKRGGRVSEDASALILARRGADDPPGTERPGEVHGQKRGGRMMEDAGSFILVRHGADDAPGTEHPSDNHRQRRRGRNG
jgi:hypothetical protein